MALLFLTKLYNPNPMKIVNKQRPLFDRLSDGFAKAALWFAGAVILFQIVRKFFE